MTVEVVSIGITQERRRARKRYRCNQCGAIIGKRHQYYCRYYGSGLGAIKFPDRLCLACGAKRE